jgi:hypothetical protein
MTTSLIFTDFNNTFNVEFKVDLLGTNDNFTVMDIVGLDDFEVKLGMNFRRLPYTVAAFKAYAAANGLKLTKLDSNGSTVISDFQGTYYYSGLGVDLL